MQKAALYPSLAILLEACPEHLDKSLFLPRYKWLKDTRIKAKKEKNMLIADTYKLSLNGTIGNLINAYSWLYDPKQNTKITINGQLFLAMLAERLYDNGFVVDSANTDGLTNIVKKDRLKEFRTICKNWELEIGLELEESFYYKVFRRNVNNYFAWYANDKGEPLYKNEKPYIKEKGEFLTSVVLGKGYDMPIVAKALKQYFIDKTPIEDFIRNHNNIYDFCKMQKVDKKFITIWGGVKQQRTNRFFVSSDTNKGYLYKTDTVTGKQAAILKGFPVQLFNKYEEKTMEEYRIHYGYYISETKKILEEIDSRQLSLFE